MANSPAKKIIITSTKSGKSLLTCKCGVKFKPLYDFEKECLACQKEFELLENYQIREETHDLCIRYLGENFE